VQRMGQSGVEAEPVLGAAMAGQRRAWTHARQLQQRPVLAQVGEPESELWLEGLGAELAALPVGEVGLVQRRLAQR
jgi:hypothetical protein